MNQNPPYWKISLGLKLKAVNSPAAHTKINGRMAKNNAIFNFFDMCVLFKLSLPLNLIGKT